MMAAVVAPGGAVTVGSSSNGEVVVGEVESLESSLSISLVVSFSARDSADILPYV